MRLVVLESPFAAATVAEADANRAYLTRCIADALHRGEAPFASHRMYTEALDDAVPGDRALGIAAGREWLRKAADAVVVYTDRGISPGMEAGIRAAREAGVPVEMRRLGE